MPKVSIILPVYNAKKYLRECVDSVRNQKFADWELIAVDDGSTDTSGDILDRYAKQDERIRVIHKENGRVWAARNDALDIVGGEWVTFLDADDMYATYWVDEAMRVANTEHPDAIMLGYVSGRDVPRNLNDEPFTPPMVRTYSGNSAGKWYWRAFTNNGFLWMWFFQRSVIGTCRFRPVINCKEDGIWLLELAPYITRVSESVYKGYFYRNTEASLSKRQRHISQCVAYLSAW